MSYVIYATPRGKVGQITYRFEVKGLEKGKRFVFDIIGWYKINYFFTSSLGFNVNQRFFFFNINKLAIWAMRGVDFKPKAFILIFQYCLFLIIQKNILKLRKELN